MEPIKINKYTIEFEKPIEFLGEEIKVDEVFTDSEEKVDFIVRNAYQLSEDNSFKIVSVEEVELYGDIKPVRTNKLLKP